MNDKIPEGNICESEGKDCPCLYDMMYCQLFETGLEYDENVNRIRCEACQKIFPNGGKIVPEDS